MNLRINCIIILFLISSNVKCSEINLLCEVTEQKHFKNGNIDQNPNFSKLIRSFNIKIKNFNSNKSIEVIHPYPENIELYSDNACFDDPYHRSWGEVWKQRNKAGQGCSSYARFDDEFYVGHLSTQPDYDAGNWSTSHEIKINRRSGLFEKVFVNTKYQDSGTYLSWLDQYSGYCKLSDTLF